MAAQTDDFEEWPNADGPGSHRVQGAAEHSGESRFHGPYLSTQVTACTFTPMGVRRLARPCSLVGNTRNLLMGSLSARSLGAAWSLALVRVPLTASGVWRPSKEGFVFLRSTEGWRRGLSEA